jgi:hypothetical protein
MQRSGWAEWKGVEKTRTRGATTQEGYLGQDGNSSGNTDYRQTRQLAVQMNRCSSIQAHGIVSSRLVCYCGLSIVDLVVQLFDLLDHLCVRDWRTQDTHPLISESGK